MSLKGGDRMEKVLSEIGKRIEGGPFVKVGYLASATYPDGMPVAQVAFWQEFGTPGAQFPIPPRPTFRMMIAKHRNEWGSQLAVALKSKAYDARKALGVMGQLMTEELQESVRSAEVLALSLVTLMLRKMRSQMPSLRVSLRTVYEAIARVQRGESGASGTQARRLIDTGVMLRYSDYEVSE